MVVFTDFYTVNLTGKNVSFQINPPMTVVRKLMIGMFSNVDTAGAVGLMEVRLFIGNKNLCAYLGPCDGSANGTPMSSYDFGMDPLEMTAGTNATLQVTRMFDDAGAVANYTGYVGLKLIMEN